MTDAKNKVSTDRQRLIDASNRGAGATFAAFLRLSGPGWLQSAITLGGGSLASALLMGALGGVSMLWLQLVAIICGVIMLSAISYVTLSTRLRPLEAINRYINPALGWGWVIATVLANVIWVMPQFALSFDALQKNLTGGWVDPQAKLPVSLVLFALAMAAVLLNVRGGVGARIFDAVLKGLVAMAVLSFFAVVAYLTWRGELNWANILAGFVPDLSQWTRPAGELAEVVSRAPAEYQEYWSRQIVQKQQSVMISAAATAVGINMTFLLPYSLLRRGWDQPFRGLARFDLLFAMAIPYILVTSCIVIAADSAFHASIDDAMKSRRPQEVRNSLLFTDATNIFEKRLIQEHGATLFADIRARPAETEQQKHAQQAAMEQRIAEHVAEWSEAERVLAVSLVKRNAFHLSQTLTPILGDQLAKTLFGIGVFAMAFSTIMILMLINGYAFCEIVGRPNSQWAFAVGCLVSGIAGICWPLVWAGESRFWLTIMASVFGMMLLPIAYTTFFIMLNSKRILGTEKPTGGAMWIWNILMFFALAGAIIAACSAVYTKATDQTHPAAFYVVLSIAIVYAVWVVVGFVQVHIRKNRSAAER